MCLIIWLVHDVLMKNPEFPNLPISRFWDLAKNVIGMAKNFVGPYCQGPIKPLGKKFWTKKQIAIS